jgi:hypothetical protein
MTIHAVVKKAQEMIGASLTYLQCPEYVTDAQFAEPTCMAWPVNVRFATRGGFSNTLFDMRLEVYIPKTDLTENVYYLDGIPEAINTLFDPGKGGDPTIGGTCQTYSGEITADFGSIALPDITFVGWVITIPGIKL